MKSVETISFLTYGCKVNQFDTDRISASLSKDFKIIDDNSDSDLCIVNTCTVTNNSDRQVVNDIKRLKRNNPKCKILVTGCLSQTNPESLEQVPEIDYIVDNANKYLISKVISNSTIKKKVVSNIFDINRFDDFKIDQKEKRSRAFLSVQDGCSFRCSFCIIPFARGKSRSMKLDSVIEKINQFAILGYNEVVLSGIHLSSYGLDIDTNLLELLRQIEDSVDIPNIRLSSIDPADTNKDLIQFFSKSKKICPSFHISLQSGSETILQLMKRRYRISKFENIIKLIKENIESSCVGTDVIAGFPGETNDLFKESYDYIQKSLLDYLHVFPYSDRRGTKASIREDKVSEDLKKSRSKALRELGESKKIDFYSKFIGKRLAAISEKNYHARTRNYIDVNMMKKEFVEPGKMMDLIIDKIEDGKAYGRYI
ncbi:MAG: tRNA (N(6)-L-threonylcarbamoyladenosine(37)-C(2))-methylthiotransferase MtaB [Thermodesulfobacteriota bacteirum]|nr:tRNA (N(6)-L-threonylcarbamoyladenosine(37)-C(2))-methylthiotransferase MtaB [Thermodesulfobacteriota bacterium]